jgi:hypothetical protein
VCRSFIYLLFQPTSIAKATVPEILFPYYRFRSLTSLATPVFANSYLLSHLYGLFDDRFFEYYFVFLAGLLLARHDEFRERIFNVPVFAQLSIAVVGAVLFGIFEFGGYRARSAVYLVSSNVYILSWVILALKFFQAGLLNWRIWAPISYGSFFAYLFHRPIWEIMFWYIPFPWDIHGGWYRLVPGAIIVFVVCYYLQAGYDLILKSGSDLWKRLTTGNAG